MAENQHENHPPDSGEELEAGIDLRNVRFLADHKRRQHEPPATDDELAEYRALRPKLLQMLKEWELLKSARGCPVASGIFGND